MKVKLRKKNARHAARIAAREGISVKKLVNKILRDEWERRIEDVEEIAAFANHIEKSAGILAKEVDIMAAKK
jgi:hypothetical protein